MSSSYLEDRGPKKVADIVTRCLVKSPHLTTADGLRGQLHADAYHDALDRLHLINIPTLVTIGDEDTNTPQRYGRAVAKLIPGAQLHHFQGPRSSHCTFWEIAEEFNGVSAAFLAAHTSRQ
jgi:pimeloyl-ACP methyl ester carboxylesterase